MSLISVIVPCYNEEKALPYFYKEFRAVREQLKEEDFELIFVDDGSKDKTLEMVKELTEKDGEVKYISFSKNFGKESAIYAGLENCKGDYAVLMDADLQDPPSLLPQMLKAVREEGYDSAATYRVMRKAEPKTRTFFARRFYRLSNKISSTEMMDGARDYRLMNRRFVNAVLSMPEYERFTKGIFSWVGFKTKWIEYENVERVAGSTKWSFVKLFKYAVQGIVSFSDVLLNVSFVVGTLVCLLSLLGLVGFGVADIVGAFVSGFVYLGLGLAVLLGLNMVFIGIIGRYIVQINAEVKNRPIYITRESNFEVKR